MTQSKIKVLPASEATLLFFSTVDNSAKKKKASIVISLLDSTKPPHSFSFPSPQSLRLFFSLSSTHPTPTFLAAPFTRRSPTLLIFLFPPLPVSSPPLHHPIPNSPPPVFLRRRRHLRHHHRQWQLYGSGVRRNGQGNTFQLFSTVRCLCLILICIDPCVVDINRHESRENSPVFLSLVPPVHKPSSRRLLPSAVTFFARVGVGWRRMG